jgi:hypothetical protein
MSLVLAAMLLGLVGAQPAAAAEGPNSLALDATYDVTATLKWSKRKLIVTSTALVSNNTDSAVDALTFNFAPAQIGKMVLTQVRVGDDAAPSVTEDQNVIVTLPAPLEPGQQIPVTIGYRATFGKHSLGKQWLFAKLNGIATAYRWIPWLSRPYDFITPTFGEPFVTRTTPEVRVSLTSDKAGMIFATSGRRTGVAGRTQTFVANDVRDFNFSASPKYQTRNATWGGIPITYFYVDLPVDTLAKHTIKALERFSNRVGPYRHAELAVAESHSGYAMESPALIWIPKNSSAGNLRYLVTHEIAHQWFYSAVGNNQANQPFADEAMAEFLTRDLIGHRASKCAESLLDLRVYDYTKSCYYEVVYVQGDGYLDGYRQRVGDAAFWDGMRRYYERFSSKIAGTRDLLETLDEAARAELLPDAAKYRPRLARLRQPDRRFTKQSPSSAGGPGRRPRARPRPARPTGSGGGIDVLLSAARARRLGRPDRVPPRVRARHDRRDARPRSAQRGRGGRHQRRVLKGHIEAMPLPAASVDVVISNCVVNLAADKPPCSARSRACCGRRAAGHHRHRRRGHADAAQRAERGSYVGCIAGALSFSRVSKRVCAGRADRRVDHAHPRPCGPSSVSESRAAEISTTRATTPGISPCCSR